MNNPTDDYDSPWKESLTCYFPEFLDFYFPWHIRRSTGLNPIGDKQQIIDLFAVIDWLMTLLPELEKQLWTSISELERNIKMPYVTSIERIGIEKGIEKGRQEGRQEEGVFFLRRLLD